MGTTCPTMATTHVRSRVGMGTGRMLPCPPLGTPQPPRLIRCKRAPIFPRGLSGTHQPPRGTLRQWQGRSPPPPGVSPSYFPGGDGSSLAAEGRSGLLQSQSPAAVLPAEPGAAPPLDQHAVVRPVLGGPTQKMSDAQAQHDADLALARRLQEEEYAQARREHDLARDSERGQAGTTTTHARGQSASNAHQLQSRYASYQHQQQQHRRQQQQQQEYRMYQQEQYRRRLEQQQQQPGQAGQQGQDEGKDKSGCVLM
eukprot:Rmarinus@m.22211